MSATAAHPSAATEVDQWLARFGEALERGDAAGAAELFAPESYWRDLVAFTGTSRPSRAAPRSKTCLSTRSGT